MAVPTPPINTVLSTALAEGLKSWFAQNQYFVSVFDNTSPLFKSFNDYYRIDVPLGEMTGIVVYPLNNDTVSQPSKENGQIAIDIVFNLAYQREKRGEWIYSTIEAIRAQLLNNPTYIQTYLSRYFVPGLMMINGQNRTDYNKLNAQILKGQGAATATIIMNYKIGILLNQRALWATGNDFYSPVTPVYHDITGVDIVLETGRVRPIICYTVTPSQGYPASGSLFLPSGYLGDAILLGNDGNVVETPLDQDVESVQVEMRYLYNKVVSVAYPSKGMIVLSVNSVTGNAGKLIGDDGEVYDIVYGGENLSPIYHKEILITPDTDYPIGGTALCKINAETGNAAILFGSDGQIYSIVL